MHALNIIKTFSKRKEKQYQQPARKPLQNINPVTTTIKQIKTSIPEQIKKAKSKSEVKPSIKNLSEVTLI